MSHSVTRFVFVAAMVAAATASSACQDAASKKKMDDLAARVEKLEKGGGGLNASLALFERGVGLARFLRDELEKAEKKIEILLKDEKGGLKAEPFSLEEAEEGGEGGTGNDA